MRKQINKTMRMDKTFARKPKKSFPARAIFAAARQKPFPVCPFLHNNRKLLEKDYNFLKKPLTKRKTYAILILILSLIKEG